MALIAAILLAVFVLDGAAQWAAVAIGATIELGESWFWWRWSRRPRPVVGAETLVGRVGVVDDDGWLRIDGERWRIRGGEPGERVRVLAIDRLELVVEREDSTR